MWLPCFGVAVNVGGAFELCPNDGSSRLHGNKLHDVVFESTLIFIVMVMGASLLIDLHLGSGPLSPDAPRP